MFARVIDASFFVLTSSWRPVVHAAAELGVLTGSSQVLILIGYFGTILQVRAVRRCLTVWTTAVDCVVAVGELRPLDSYRKNQKPNYRGSET